MPDLTGPRFEPQTSSSRDERFISGLLAIFMPDAFSKEYQVQYVAF